MKEETKTICEFMHQLDMIIKHQFIEFVKEHNPPTESQLTRKGIKYSCELHEVEFKENESDEENRSRLVNKLLTYRKETHTEMESK